MEIYIKQEKDYISEKEEYCNNTQDDFCMEQKKIESSSSDLDNDDDKSKLCGTPLMTEEVDDHKTVTVFLNEKEKQFQDCCKASDGNSALKTEMSYTCSVCKYQSDSLDDYVKHMNSIHGMVRSAAAKHKHFKCKECSKQFTRSSSLKRHMQFHTGVWPMNCSVCNKGFNSICNLTIHMRIHTGEKPFKCEECSEGFTHLPSFKRHMRLHAGETPYTCTICNRGFTDSGVLKVHMRTHTGEKPFVCSVCNKTFTVASSLNKHMQIHMDEKPFKCTLCNKGFTQAVSFRRHLNLHI